MFIPISDPLDSRVRPYRRLKDVEQRQAGLFIAESELVVQRVLEQEAHVESMLLATNRPERLAASLKEAWDQRDFPAYVAPPGAITEIVGFPLHRGVLALVRRPTLPTVAELLGSANRVVVLEDVVDPDNIGSIVRHCAAFDADAILLSESASDPLYRKALRTSMGWALRIPYARGGTGPQLLDALHAHDFTTLAFTPSGDLEVRAVAASPAPARLAFVFGSETNGLRVDTMRSASARVRIDINSEIDSLNVATSVAIALFAFS